jgi:hypothetical protein
MTCDEYFDHLTSAMPSSTGQPPVAGHSPADHLAGCPRCRSLAETLEPALELFRAAVGDAPMENDAPGNLADDIPAWLLEDMEADDPDRVAKAPSLRSADTATPPIAYSRRSLAWPVLAATLIGVLAGGAVWGVSSASQRSVAHRRTNDWSAISEIQLSPACLVQRGTHAAAPSVGGQYLSAMSGTNRDQLNCCTSCHALGRVAAAACDLRLLAVSCQVCHAR